MKACKNFLTTQKTKIILLIVLFFCACAQSAPEPKFSGFLRDYSKLRVRPKLSGAMVYVNPNKRLSLYKMINLDPIQVFLADGNRLSGEPGSKEQQLARKLEEDIRESLGDSYQLVDHSGFGVLRARVAITSVRRIEPFMGVFTSQKMLGFDLQGAMFEMELLDTQRGDRVIAIVDMDKGTNYRLPKNTYAYGDTRDQLKSWAVLFRDVLDEAQGMHVTGEFHGLGKPADEEE